MVESYFGLLEYVANKGDDVVSQYGPTKEMMGLQINAEAGEMIRRDNINYSIGYMEAVQIVAGIYNHQALQVLAPNAALQLFTIQMAYGPRITLQAEKCLAKLLEDPGTRQAIAYIGRPEDGPTGHQPCTTTLQWLLREETLFCQASMRSLDLVKGLPYDLMMFSAMTQVLAHCLGVEAGYTEVTAASAHIYEQDLERRGKVSDRRFRLAEGLPRDFGQIRQMAQGVANEPLWLELGTSTSGWARAKGMKHFVPIALFTEVVDHD